jgi:hypothetical protein
MVTAVLLASVMAALPSISYARDQQYEAKQIGLKVDGVLSEWGDSDVMPFDQLKDVGASLPDATDFSGSGMIGWNSSDPNRIYFAATITDDINQDIHPNDDTWWEDDSLEVMFDFQNDGNLVQWTIDANGTEISASAVADNLEWIVVDKGDGYIFEGAIDPTKAGMDFEAEVGKVIGLAFHFNDCENGTREHQIGWTPGGAWDAAAYGDLIFDATVVAAVGLPGKMTTTWGSLRSQ